MNRKQIVREGNQISNQIAIEADKKGWEWERKSSKERERLESAVNQLIFVSDKDVKNSKDTKGKIITNVQYRGMTYDSFLHLIGPKDSPFCRRNEGVGRYKSPNHIAIGLQCTLN